MAGLFSTGSSKSTQPWDKQYGLWSLLSMMDPAFADSFQSAKPNMYKQVFGKGTDPESISQGSPISRLFQDYNPQSYLDNMGRPATDAETKLLGNSLFGLAAPIDLSGAQASNINMQDLLKSLNPAGSAFGQSFANLQNVIGKPTQGQQMPTPPQAPGIPDRSQMGPFSASAGMGQMPTPGAAQFGVAPQGPQSLQTSGGNGNILGTTAGGLQKFLQLLAGGRQPQFQGGY